MTTSESNPSLRAARTAIVTGAASGIGRATALRLASDGLKVAVVDLPGTPLIEVRDLAMKMGGVQACAIEADVSNAEQVAAYVERARAQLGPIDCFVNNAGILGWVGPMVDYPEDLFDRVIAVNLKGVWLGMRSVARTMRADGTRGSIVNTASVAGLRATPMFAAYCAAKHGVVGLTRVAARELAVDGIRVNAICPAPIETQMIRDLERGVDPDAPEAAMRRMQAALPLQRYGTPDEVAATIAYLLGDQSSYLTGAILPVDGGMTA